MLFSFEECVIILNYLLVTLIAIMLNLLSYLAIDLPPRSFEPGAAQKRGCGRSPHIGRSIGMPIFMWKIWEN